MHSANQKLSVDQLQSSIEQINGVGSARILMDEQGEIAEVHLVGSSRRKAKQIVRDTESLLYAQFGLRIDYRKISLVQLDASTAASDPTRLRFLSAQNGNGTERVCVTLRNEQRTFEGLAQTNHREQGSTGGQAVAEATIGAVRQAIGAIAELYVQDMITTVANGQEIALVVVRASTSRGQEFLTGTCLVRKSQYDAVAKATLDAINRRIPVWQLHEKERSENASRYSQESATTP